MNFLLSLIVFSYVSVAFYFAINNALSVKTVDYTQYNFALNNTQYGRSVESAAMIKKNDISILKTSCESTRYSISQLIVPNITYYDELNAQNKSCHDYLDSLNRTLQEVKNNGTLDLLGQGVCLFLNTTINYQYKRLTLNVYDFYYYVFPTSDPIFTNSSTLYIDSCVPIIFKGGPKMNKTYTSGIDSVGAVNYLEIGEEKVKIQMQTGMQTVQLNNFQIIN